MSRPWFPLYPADYRSDTLHLDAVEHGCYLCLLMESWVHGPLPDNVHRLARICRGPEDRVRAVLEEFWTLGPDGWVNPRLEEERQKGEEVYQAKVTRMAEARARRLRSSNQASNQGLITGQSTGQISSGQPQPQPQPQDPPDPKNKTPPSLRSGCPPSRARETGPPPEQTCPRADGAQATSQQSHGSRLPEDWICPPAWLAWAETHGLNGRAAAEAERFRDYWHACAGAKARKADWQATWRNWVRMAAEDSARKPALQRPSTDGGWRELAAQYGIRVRTQTYTQLWDEILAAARAKT